ncbi:MAG: hypothetical protein KAR85_07885 [Methanosarcinales archaeon]|nr:hypothetical protein [Methanosarcinales archaeon]
MKNQSIILVIFLVLALLVVPVANADKSNANLVQELSALDSFHPELSNDSYKEWHYFNIIDETNDLKFFVTFNVGGNQTESTGYGIVLMAYMIGDYPSATQEYYSIQSIDVSDDSPDLTFNDNNYVRLMPNGYRVNAEINGTDVYGNPIHIIYDATYIPKADPTQIFNGDIGDTPGDMNWVSAAPACKVEGSLTINEVKYNLDGVRGYHDHNFGIWDWGDNIGWDWGQAIEMNYDDPDTDVGRYTIVLGRLTDGSHIPDTGNRLLLWKNKAQIGIFQNVEFKYVMMGLYPEYITATAQSDVDSVTSVFHTSSAMPIRIDPNLDFIIWELTGIYTVTGTIDGKSINFCTEGFAEYAY